MGTRFISLVGDEAVTLEEAKTHLRLEESVDDEFVEVLCKAARQHVEKVCWRAVPVTKFLLELPSFRGADKYEQLPDYVAAIPQPYPSASSRFEPFIELPFGNLTVPPVVEIKYLDSTGTLQTLDPSTYALDLSDNRNGRVWLADGKVWPSHRTQFNAVQITYDVGFTEIPEDLRHAIKLLIGQMYEYRTIEITGTIATELQFTLDALCSPYRLLRL